MRAAPYIRVSTDEQFKHGYSVPEQTHDLERECQQRGYEIVEVVVEPDGDSGYFRDRVGLQRVYELAEAGAIDIIFAKKRDRLFRNLRDRLNAEEDLAEFGVTLVALNDTGNIFGDVVQDTAAQQYRQDFIDNSRSGKFRKAKMGETHGSSVPPYGFIYSEDRKSLVVDPETMPLVRRMFEMVADGETLYGVSKVFNDEGIPTMRGGPRWYPVSMKRLICNDAFKGTWYYGKERAELTKGKTKAGNRKRKKKTNPEDQWIAVPVVDSGIPHEVIDKARENLNKNYRPRAKAQHYYELKGLVYCEECGLRMTTYTAGGYRYYICQRRRKFKVGDPDYCNGPLRTAETTTTRKRSVGLENEAMDYVQDLISKPEKLSGQIDAAISQVQGRRDDSATWAGVIERCERDRAADQEMFRNGAMTIVELTANLERYEEQRRVAEGHLAESRNQQQRVEELRATKRALLEAYVGEIHYDGIQYLSPELRRDIYDALQLQVYVAADGTARFTGAADVRVIKLTRALEDHGEASYGRLRVSSSSKSTDKVMAEVAG